MNHYGNRILFVAILFIIITIAACGKADPADPDPPSGVPVWLVDTNLLTGTRITDRFPLIVNPLYLTSETAPRQSLSDQAVVFKIHNTVYIFPHWAMGAEVINDENSGIPFAVTYCPKTQTTCVVSRQNDKKLLTLRASGILYQNNLVYYDLETESLWSQLWLRCIHGKFTGQEAVVIPSFETYYGFALESFPGAKVFTGPHPGFSQQKLSTPSTIPGSGDLVVGFPQNRTKRDHLPVLNTRDLKGLGIIESDEKMIVYHEANAFVLAFQSRKDLHFTVWDGFPVILKDHRGTLWNVFGEATEGPGQGETLLALPSVPAYWWAWKEIYSEFSFIE